MDNIVYRNELDRIRYTAEGRAALAEQLMRAQSAERGRRSVRWPRKMMAAAIAAAVLVGTAAAAAGPLWERYFGHLDEGQQAVIDSLSATPETLPAAESNGTVMTPLAAFGDRDFYYLMLEIRAPEGTVLPDYGEEKGYYQLFGDVPGEKISLMDGDGQELYNNREFAWMPRTGEDNVLTAVLRLWPAEGVDFSDGTDKILHIPGLWVQSPDKVYTPVLTGSWDFNIGAHSGGVESRTPDVAGVTVESEDCGTMTLEYLRISPLGMRIRYSWSDPVEGVWPSAELAVVMKDGSEVSLANSVGSAGEDWSEAYGPFDTPVNIEQAAAVRWGDAIIPLEAD